jgi:hypothetical protein
MTQNHTFVPSNKKLTPQLGTKKPNTPKTLNMTSKTPLIFLYIYIYIFTSVLVFWVYFFFFF